MIYAVDKYLDQIRVKVEREYEYIGKGEKYHYFDTEKDARDFIRNRAQKGVHQAELELDRAVARSRKCYKKFPTIKIPEPDERSDAAGERQK